MYWLTSHIIPSLQTLQIHGDTDAFISWMSEIHPDKNPEELYEGYWFSINCCLNSFVDGICGDKLLGIENDFLLNRALAEVIPLHQIKSTCEKTIFLKNLKPHVKSVLRARTYNGLTEKCKGFNEAIASRFEQIKKTNLVLSKKVGIDTTTTANKLLLIDYAHTFLVQINNNGPTANTRHPFNVQWTPKEKMKHYLIGYKYAIQFLWYQLLGPDEFNKTHLTGIHLADSWRKYKYIEKEKSEDPVRDIFNREFNLEEQTSFDSYFYWIQREITNPLHDQYGIAVHAIDDQFQFNPKGYNKQSLFGDLLDEKNIPQEDQKMGWPDQIKERLYWYPFEIVDTRVSQMHHGIPSFNTMLAGTVALHNPKESEFSKVIVAKFTHPHAGYKAKNDYSYGILVDTKSAAGHYSSGWVIYQNACGDYSGFYGSEHKSSEKLIAKYLRSGKIELRELSIPLKKFTEFTDEYVLDQEQLSILEENKLVEDIIQKSRSNLFELFTYYLCTKFYGDKYRVHFGTGKKTAEGEKDIVVENDQEVIVIECKLNPQNYDMNKVVEKLEKKVASYSQPMKSGQLWCWEELSSQNKQLLDQSIIEDNPVKNIVVSEPKGEQILKGIDLKLLRFIMQDYRRNAYSEYIDFIPEDLKGE